MTRVALLVLAGILTLSSPALAQEFGLKAGLTTTESLADLVVSVAIGGSLHRGHFSPDGRSVHGLRNVIKHAPGGPPPPHWR